MTIGPGRIREEVNRDTIDMNTGMNDKELRPSWFVGASYGRTDDQTPRFLLEGIWKNGYEDKYVELVRSMRPGDRIAIKSTYIRKHDFPFDNRGNVVSIPPPSHLSTLS